MSRREKWQREGFRFSLIWLLVSFILAVLINAVLLTSAAYMILMRTGLMQPLKKWTFWPLLLVITGIIFVLIMAFGFGRQKLRPIHEVNKAMKRVSKGDFSARVDAGNSMGEIRELVASYNRMAEDLNGIEMFRTDFINNFSHEFKTPIVSIRGFAKQLERDDLSDEQRREYTRIIAAESERLANMSANVLLLSKLENQQIITDRADYSLDEQLRSCLLLLEKQWSDKEIELRLDLDELTYCGNKELMQHVWVNLIGNAIKFSPAGSELEISCMQVQSFYKISIRDHGEGMSLETQVRIFEKFYQGDSAHATEGNGLGLALVKRIVDLCGGKIAVNSAPGAGTTFTVYLPVEEGA